MRLLPNLLRRRDPSPVLQKADLRPCGESRGSPQQRCNVGRGDLWRSVWQTITTNYKFVKVNLCARQIRVICHQESSLLGKAFRILASAARQSGTATSCNTSRALNFSSPFEKKTELMIIIFGILKQIVVSNTKYLVVNI